MIARVLVWLGLAPPPLPGPDPGDMAVGGKVYAVDMQRVHAGADPRLVRAERIAALADKK